MTKDAQAELRARTRARANLTGEGNTRADPKIRLCTSVYSIANSVNCGSFRLRLSCLPGMHRNLQGPSGAQNSSSR